MVEDLVVFKVIIIRVLDGSMLINLLLGFRRIAMSAGSIVTPLVISFASAVGSEPSFPSVYNRRLTLDCVVSTKVCELKTTLPDVYSCEGCRGHVRGYFIPC